MHEWHPSLLLFFIKKINKNTRHDHICADWLPTCLAARIMNGSFCIKRRFDFSFPCKLWQTCSCKTYLLLLIWKRYIDTHVCMYIFIYVCTIFHEEKLAVSSNKWLYGIYFKRQVFFRGRFHWSVCTLQFQYIWTANIGAKKCFYKDYNFTCNSMSEYTENFVCYFVNKLVM